MDERRTPSGVKIRNAAGCAAIAFLIVVVVFAAGVQWGLSQRKSILLRVGSIDPSEISAIEVGITNPFQSPISLKFTKQVDIRRMFVDPLNKGRQVDHPPNKGIGLGFVYITFESGGREQVYLETWDCVMSLKGKGVELDLSELKKAAEAKQSTDG